MQSDAGLIGKKQITAKAEKRTRVRMWLRIPGRDSNSQGQRKLASLASLEHKVSHHKALTNDAIFDAKILHVILRHVISVFGASLDVA